MPLRPFSVSKDWQVPRGIRTTRAILVLMFMGILLWAGIMKNALQSVTRFGWALVVIFALFMLYEIYADWRAPKSK